MNKTFSIYQILPYIAIVVLLVCYIVISANNFSSKIEALEDENNELKTCYIELETKYNTLDQEEEKVIIRYRYIKEQINNKEDETYSSVNAVNGLSEREIDRTIRQHTHKPSY